MTAIEDLSYSMDWFVSMDGEVLFERSVEDVPLGKGQTRVIETELATQPDGTIEVEVILSPLHLVEILFAELQAIVDENPNTELADKIEDALEKVEVVLEELYKLPPDYQAALGNLEGLVGDLEAALKDGLLDTGLGTHLLDEFVEVARRMAVDALNMAIAAGGDQDKIDKALEYLAEGVELWESGKWKDAVAAFKAALCEAESAMP